MAGKQPSDAPPSYDQATGSSTNTSGGHLNVPSSSNGISTAARRSMEDEARPVPEGWVRQYDAKSEHQFFVDTHADPPRSIWHHPYDDDKYLSTLSSEQRERIQEEERRRMPPRKSFESSEEEYDTKKPEHYAATSPIDGAGAGAGASNSNAAAFTGADGNKKSTFGRKLKDKVTGSTHEQRVEERRRQAEQEQKMYETHQKMRTAMQRAVETGEPQLIGQDRDGKDVYIEPPGGPSGSYGGGGYPGRENVRGYNPYAAPGGPYSNPNARFIRPSNPYSRPAYGSSPYGGYGYGGGYGGRYGGYGGYGRGYGGGLGLPLAGGLLGGLMIGGALGGF